MSKVQLQGNVSGTGVFTIASPNSNTDRTLTLPDVSGTIQTTGAAIARSQLPAGSILQVVYGETTDRTAWSGITSWTDSGITATITPTSASSRILVLVDGKFGGTDSGVNFTLRLLRNATLIYAGTDTGNKQGFAHLEQGWAAFQYFIFPTNATTVDSPASTSALTYKVQFLPNTTSGSIFINRTANNSSSQGNTRSSITLLEIAG
jgi:hypothetical protein